MHRSLLQHACGGHRTGIGDPRDWTQVVKLGSTCLSPVSHLAGPNSVLYSFCKNIRVKKPMPKIPVLRGSSDCSKEKMVLRYLELNLVYVVFLLWAKDWILRLQSIVSKRAIKIYQLLVDRAIGLINWIYLKVDLCFKCVSFSLSHFVLLYKKGPRYKVERT